MAKTKVILTLVTVILFALPTTATARKIKQLETPAPTVVENVLEKKSLKRKVAIGRFSNETSYSKGLFYDKENDPMGKQALDILSTKLAASEKFLLLERNDLAEILEECKQNGSDFSRIGADYMIIGSVTEFGRKTVGKSNGLSAEKSQIVEAAVAIRIVDTSNGRIIYSEEGKGEASLTTKSGLFTSQTAEYDATLSDKAISAAISQLVENIINKCTDRPWRTYFLSYDADGIIIAGGESQGLNVGDELTVKTKGRKVKNPQTGIMIELPGKTIGSIRIEECGGNTPEEEYSIVSLVDIDELTGDVVNNYVIEEL